MELILACELLPVSWPLLPHQGIPEHLPAWHSPISHLSVTAVEIPCPTISWLAPPVMVTGGWGLAGCQEGASSLQRGSVITEKWTQPAQPRQVKLWRKIASH